MSEDGGAGMSGDFHHGDWQRTPFDGTQGLFVIEARAL